MALQRQNVSTDFNDYQANYPILINLPKDISFLNDHLGVHNQSLVMCVI